MKENVTSESGIKLEYGFVKETIEKTIIKWKPLKLLSKEYFNVNQKLSILDEDKYMYSIGYTNIIQNYERNQDFNRFHPSNKYTIHNIKNWIKRNNINTQIISTYYKNAKSKLLWRCPENHEFLMNWNNFQGGKRCPFCKSSNGEKAIMKFLDKNRVSYKKEYIFKDCKNIKPLPFDFAIFKNQKLYCLVEYDGMQHFIKTGWDNEKDSKLKRTMLTDSIRDEYCLRNNINLIRIPYWDFYNLEDILLKHLKAVIK